MARFVNINPGGRVILRHNKDQRLTDGSSIQLSSGLYADFEPNSFTEWEQEAAYERFGNEIRKGSRMNDEGGTLGTIPQSQSWRIGVFDTNWLPSEDRAEAEKLMMEHKNYGKTFIRVDKPRLSAPFPAWDEVRGRGNKNTAELLAEYVKNLGLDPGACIAYERENQDRAEVIKAIEDLAHAGEPEPTIEVLA